MNDYERIATVLRFLDRHHSEQPDLAALARQVGLSTFHFHRLFSAWAGVTPKDFLQCLTVERVKEILRGSETVLDAALDVGLSGPGRLHDLCVNLEAASPGEIKNAGENIDILYGVTATPFGEALIAETARGICHLSFIDSENADDAVARLRSDWSRANFSRNEKRAAELATSIFARAQDRQSSGRRTLRAFVRGTPFQVKVWRALLQIPEGKLTTYGRLASMIDLPGASRAVGSAVGANPLAFIIPCHRVIRQTGVLGNYRWDPVRKRAMIGWETSLRDRLHATAA